MATRRMVLLSLAGLLAGPGVAAAAALTGVRHDGARIGPADLPGWKLVYFGYTHCPDVCPMGLQTMAEAIDALGAVGERITPVFVTVDPERDTPALMKTYVGYFHARFVGLSPSLAELPELAAAWRVKYAKVPGSNPDSYTMDHTASVFLADPAGAVVGRFPHDLGGAAMANKIRSVLLAR